MLPRTEEGGMRSDYLLSGYGLLGVELMEIFWNKIVVMLEQQYGDSGEYSKNH